MLARESGTILQPRPDAPGVPVGTTSSYSTTLSSRTALPKFSVTVLRCGGYCGKKAGPGRSAFSPPPITMQTSLQTVSAGSAASATAGTQSHPPNKNRWHLGRRFILQGRLPVGVTAF